MSVLVAWKFAICGYARFGLLKKVKKVMFDEGRCRQYVEH